MIGISNLGQAASEKLTRFHNFAKNVETAHLGKLYTTFIDNLNYYVVECVAKPVWRAAPPSVSNNRAVSFIQNHKGLSIIVAGVATAALSIYIIVMLHPPTKEAVKAITPPIDPNTVSPTVPGPDGASQAERVSKDDNIVNDTLTDSPVITGTDETEVK
jgi:hypothetical protein